MRISQFTDYAFRLLIAVASRHPELTTIAQVAKAYNISHHHLSKIARELGRSGYLETVRGRHGGLRLARPAEEISIGAIARFAERGSPLVECFDERTNRCVITPACQLKFMLADAETAFFKTLDGHTLAEIIAHRRRLRPYFNGVEV
jgi:Rrf2 family nitric oxide-sensitive transcriptional repressor